MLLLARNLFVKSAKSTIAINPSASNKKQAPAELISKPWNPSKQLNITPDSRGLKVRLEREAQVDPVKQAQMEAIYGRDPFCPDWEYESAVPFPDFHDFIAKGYPSQQVFSKYKREILLYHCARLAVWTLVGHAAQYCDNPAEALFCLKGGLRGGEVDSTALFRYEVVWPIWGSSQAFWEDVIKTLKETDDIYNYYWPKKAPKMSAGEVLEYFESIGCDSGIKLTKLIIICDGADYPFTDNTIYIHRYA